MESPVNYMNENTPFLINQVGVKLTPSWEAQSVPDDELNFKDLSMDKVKMTLKPPKDKWNLVLLIFILHGLGTLTPWNMFITAKSYFVDFKLASDSVANDTNITNYARNFMSYIGFASQIPNLLFNWLNIFVNLGGDLTRRIVYSILLEIILFIITVILAMVNTNDWQESFFWITIVTVVLLNMANGIYQNTIYGMAAILPIKYTGAIVLGSNISGLFASIISICSTYLFSAKRTSAIYYFITAIIVLLVCFDTYFALPLNKFFRYHQLIAKGETENTQSKSTKISYYKVFKEALPQLLNVFLIFFVTLSVFPAVYSDVKRSNNSEFFISEELFTPITCFFTFNLFAMLGSLITSWIQWPKPKYLVVPVLLRLLFIPLFLFCNYHPIGSNRTLTVIIENEWIYWSLGLIMSFTSGYLSSLAMMYAPKSVSPENQITAGMFAAAMLITGIFSGICLSFIFPDIVTSMAF